jgi:hypothetical protein
MAGEARSHDESLLGERVHEGGVLVILNPENWPRSRSRLPQ